MILSEEHSSLSDREGGYSVVVRAGGDEFANEPRADEVLIEKQALPKEVVQPEDDVVE